MRRRVRTARDPGTQLRDMEESSFARILSDLVCRIPGAYAAALVDSQGESVDYAGTVEPFDVKIAAAYWRIVLDDIARSSLGPPRSVVVRGTTKSFVITSLPDKYALVVLLRKRAGFVHATRAFAACIRALHVEAEWTLRPNEAAWFAVTVACDPRGRPVSVLQPAAPSRAVEVLGAVAGLHRTAKGYRVRSEKGVEATLVREAGGFWYADEVML